MFDEHGRWCLYTQSFIQVMLLQAMFLYILQTTNILVVGKSKPQTCHENSRSETLVRECNLPFNKRGHGVLPCTFHSRVKHLTVNVTRILLSITGLLLSKTLHSLLRTSCEKKGVHDVVTTQQKVIRMQNARPRES